MCGRGGEGGGGGSLKVVFRTEPLLVMPVIRGTFCVVLVPTIRARGVHKARHSSTVCKAGAAYHQGQLQCGAD